MKTLTPLSCLIPLKAGTKDQVLFIVPGIGGRVDGLFPLAGLLETPMAVYGILARGLDGSTPADARVEDMASHYLGEIRVVQPLGPYFLCGHSSGGLVAFQMARILVAAGEKVAALILLDVGVHPKYWPRSYFVSFMFRRVLFHFRTIRHLPVSRMIQHINHAVRSLSTNWVLQRFGARQRFRDMESADLTLAEREVLVGGCLAVARYRPIFYPGRMIYFRAASEGPVSFDPHVIWRGRVRELEVHTFGGSHVTMLRPPHVTRLATELDSSLNRLAKVGSLEQPAAR